MSQHVVKLYNKQYTLKTDELYSVFVKVDIMDGDANTAKPVVNNEGNDAVLLNANNEIVNPVEMMGGKGSRKRRVRKPRTTMKK
jgi:hypothetical protein